MTGLVEVFQGVPVRARIATTDAAAGQTHPQVRPGVLAKFRAPLAFARCLRLGLHDLRGEVLARFGDHCGVRIAPT
jgi:hypothetical protein